MTALDKFLEEAAATNELDIPMQFVHFEPFRATNRLAKQAYEIHVLLAVVEAQRAELNRLFDMAQSSPGAVAGTAGVAKIEAWFKKGEFSK